MPSVITGRTKQQERQIQTRLMQVISSRFERAYRGEILRAMREIGRSAGSVGDISMAEQRHRENLSKILYRNYQAANVFGERILRAVNKSVNNLLTKEEMPSTEIFAQSMQDFIAITGAARVAEIAGTTKAQAMSIINAAVTDGISEGLGEAAIARNIQSEMNSKAVSLSAFRSRVIARTETSTAANTATHNAGKATGIPMKKEWSTALDGRERDTHKSANGQRVGMNDKFTVGKAKLLHPSDPKGRAEEVINCRCVELLMVDL